MPKIKIQDFNFRTSSRQLISKVNQVIDSYSGMGIDLTLRQVYYRLVAAGIIPNNERSYKNLGELISNGRLAGLIDWNAIIDRTRGLRGNSHWLDPSHIIDSCARGYAVDKWDGQPYYVEVWVEKDAQIGIIQNACIPLDVPSLSARGYISQSEMWRASNRIRRHRELGSQPVVIYLGDHDPSGLDMGRDIVERLRMFGEEPIFERIALTREQIDTYNPPPNPAKLTDSRCGAYIIEHGESSWELDALEPKYTIELIGNTIKKYRNDSLYSEAVAREKQGADLLALCSRRWAEVVTLLSQGEVE